jgi:hypothetical protein
MIELVKDSDVQASPVSDCEQQPSGKARMGSRLTSKRTKLVCDPHHILYVRYGLSSRSQGKETL